MPNDGDLSIEDVYAPIPPWYDPGEHPELRLLRTVDGTDSQLFNDLNC
jgi:hypothetical protein